MSKFLIVTIAGKIGSFDVGFGHLNRSIVIANEVIKRGYSVYFLYSGDQKAEQINLLGDSALYYENWINKSEFIYNRESINYSSKNK